MKRLIRTLSGFLLCFCVLLGCLPGARAAEGDEIRAAKKIISVVYDDSGSMYDESRYIYANYAMQGLAALLNEQDELYITYMSEVEHSPKDPVARLDLRQIEAAVQSIRAMGYSGQSTPGEAMDHAFSRLAGSKETDPTTQFWLVVMTDGKFTSPAGLSQGDALRNKLAGFAGTAMSNGTAPNVVYLSMGTGSAIQSEPAIGLYSFRASNSREISSVLKEIAAMVSVRFAVGSLSMPDAKTLRFDTSVPLYSISILSQNSRATVSSAEAGGDALSVSRNVALEKNNVVGNAAVLVRHSAGVRDVIPAGSFTVHFSEPVEKDQLTVQYEPAIGMKAAISRGGQEITDLAELAVDEKINITLTPVIPGTDTEIPLGDLPKGITWTVSYEQGGKTIASEKDRSLKGVVLPEGDSLVRGSMQIPGFAPLLYEIPLKLEANRLKNLGITAEQPDPLIYPRADLDKREQGSVVFRLTADGRVLDAGEIKQAGLKLQIVETDCDNSGVERWLKGRVEVGTRLVAEKDGSIRLDVISPGIVSFAIKSGLYTVRVQLVQDSGVTAEGRFEIRGEYKDWFNLLKFLIAVVLALFELWNWFLKPKFKQTTVCYRKYDILADGRGANAAGGDDSITLGWLSGNNLLFPQLYGASHVSYQGLTLVAGKGGVIRVTGSSIAAAAEKSGSSDRDPLRHAGRIAKKLGDTRPKEEDGEKAKRRQKTRLDDYELSTVPLYFRDTAESTSIWCLFIKED